MTPPPGQRPTTPPPEDQVDDEMDYLLSAGLLSGSQRDRIAAQLAKGQRPLQASRRRGRSRFYGRLGATVVLAAVAGVVLWTGGLRHADQFRAKGDGATVPVAIDLACVRGALSACPRGSLVAISVGGPSDGLFVTASLEPVTTGRRLWLLKNEPASRKAPTDPDLLARAARIPEDQAAGGYRAQIVISRRPLPVSHEMVLDPHASDVVARAQFAITVTP